MQSLEDIDRLLDSWGKLLAEIPEKKREVLEAMGQRLLQDVRQEIGGQGKVQGWQERYLGSRNGYVAIRAKADTYQVTNSGKRYAVGHVTNAIENGHKAGAGRVAGRGFYRSVRSRAKEADPAELRQLMAEIVQGLEGRL